VAQGVIDGLEVVQVDQDQPAVEVLRGGLHDLLR
jgi:hypothetical protein